MGRLFELPRRLEGTLHRVLVDEGLAPLFRFRHNWHRFFSFLYLTGIKPADMAMLTGRNLSRVRNVIGYHKQTGGGYEEVETLPHLLDVFPVDMSEDQPLFPSLYSDIENDDHRADQSNEKLGVPAEYMESLLLAAGRPAASLMAFRVTILSGKKETNYSFLKSFVSRLTDPLNDHEMPQS